jgi:predicted amidohydrolase YtcJ
MSSSQFAIYSASVFTGTPEQPWAQAIGVKDGRIIAVGTNDQVKSVMADAEPLDLAGRLVTAGFVDAHCHMVTFGRAGLMVDLAGLDSIDVCLVKIRQAVSAAEPGQWVIGRGWNQHLWKEHRDPTRHDFDSFSPDNPLLMTRVCGHSEWVNSLALRAANIKNDSVLPEGIQYERDSSGEFTGLLHEAKALFDSVIPQPSESQLEEAAIKAQQEYLKCGVTGVHTCESLAEYRILERLESNDLLNLRVHHLMQYHDLEQADEMGLTWLSGTDRLWLGHLKLYADGSLGAGTALMHEPYSDEPDNSGIHSLDPDELKYYVCEAYKRGFSVAVHAIGDKAGTNVLDAYAHGRRLYPGARRDQMEHVQLYAPNDFDRYRELGVTASVQPKFISTDWDLAGRRWGEERSSRAYAWKNLLDNGVALQFGTDAPIEPINPLLGLQAAVLRQTPEGLPEGGWTPDQRLTLEQCLIGYTQQAAYTAGKEDRLGMIKPGFLADLTVFEADLRTVPAEQWHTIKAEMTIIDGKIVYGG